jgi:hypothetical protein
VDFRKAWKSATDAAECPGLLIHDLRRTGVRNLRRLGVAESVAMKISGIRQPAFSAVTTSLLSPTCVMLQNCSTRSKRISLAIVQP